MSVLFDDMFDFDRDGEMDSFEKAAEFNTLWKIFWTMKEVKEGENSAIYLTMMTKTTTMMMAMMISDLSFTKRPFCRSLMLL